MRTMKGARVATATREYRKCPACGEYRHDLMYPWADPDADIAPRTKRPPESRAAAVWDKRAAEYAARRKAAQALGRNYSACLPCVNGDA